MKTHPLNVSYLVMGLIFLGLAGSWALREAGVVDLDSVRWLFPMTLVVAGVVGLVAAAAKGLTGRDGNGAADGADHTDPYSPYDLEGDDR
ncbi:MAG TPA: hypothetical protein VLA97_11530 [Nocardioidaceae bacterium]|nr:hypothetical protein [Nocardioidaceae bacterium]